MNFRFLTLTALLSAVLASAQPREQILINNDWSFHLGHAGDVEKDYSFGTDYFSHFAKVAAFSRSKAPVSEKFLEDDTWEKINLPHDWAVDLSYDAAASHSHGNKTLGLKYPEHSIGWYRKTVFIPESDKGRRISVLFEGIFRDCEVFFNEYYVGHEVSGYASKSYDVSEYVNYGGDNVICVRVDASMEEGWFYEGAGIYRNVYLVKNNPLAVKQYGVKIASGHKDGVASGTVEAVVRNSSIKASGDFCVYSEIIDAQGKVVAVTDKVTKSARPQEELMTLCRFSFDNPHLWDLDDTYLYNVKTYVAQGGEIVDVYDSRIGIRNAVLDPDHGFILNGRRVQLKGVDLHQDHAGVGAGIPKELWRYRIQRLQEMGCNAIRSSHNPASPDMLDLCDEMGMVVIDENRLMGINDEHLDLFKRMIERDYNHPSIILWSVGNEEWEIEGTANGTEIAQYMTAFAHLQDPTRQTTYGCSGAHELVKGVDVFGYNYIRQNPVDDFHVQFPDRGAVGTEETTGCGTRGKFETDREHGWSRSSNRPSLTPNPRPNRNVIVNPIEVGWKFYAEREFLGGPFFWTGFDYRGEPALGFPATGSSFGLLDYCGFYKPEAYYLKSWWTSEPVLYVDEELWVYSNCDEVQLVVNGKNLGKQKMEENSHLEFSYDGKVQKIVAYGYKNGKRLVRKEIIPGNTPAGIFLAPHKDWIKPDGQDVVIIDIDSWDESLDVSVAGSATILGWGNGDPGFREVERPVGGDSKSMIIKPFCGKAQVIVRSIDGGLDPIVVKVGSTECSINIK